MELGGWVNRLKIFYDQKRETDVYNFGVSGDKVSDVLKRFDVEAQSINPDTIILAVGINDSPHATHPFGTKLSTFEKQYGQLLAKARNFTEKIILVGLTNVSSRIDLYSNSKIEKYDDIIKKIAESQKLPFIDLFGSLKKDEIADGLHPNASGHQKIFEKVKQII